MRKIQNLVEILKQFGFDLSLLICKLGKIIVPAQCDQCKDSITYEVVYKFLHCFSPMQLLYLP